MIDEKFIVNEKQGIVVCMQKYETGYIYNQKISAVNYEIDRKSFTVTGIARCSEDDKFDKKTGMMIAQTKANIKAYKKYEKWARTVFIEIKKLMETITNTVFVAEDFGKHEREKIDKLSESSVE